MVVLITGAAKGIGAAIALKYASLGYDIIINYLSSKDCACKLKKTILEKYSVEVLLIQGDITNELNVKMMFTKIKNKFSTIDILVNNAALALDNYYQDKSKEEFMKVLEVNIFGTFLVTKEALKIMNEGIIINISSTDADDTFTEYSMDYCASKAGVNNLTKNFAANVLNNKFLAVMLPWVNTDTIKNMNQEYLNEELKRTNQSRLMEVAEAALIVVNMSQDKKIKSGSIIRIGVDD
jgi:3-oxoacyl-[acyl-carrier protein] reductase